MTKLEREIHIDAAPEEVYAKLMDPDCLGDWVSIQEELLEAPDGDLEKGDKLVQRCRVAGRSFKLHWTVESADRPHKTVWKGKGPLGSKAKVTYDLAANDGGTDFTYTNEYDLLPREDANARDVFGIRGHSFERAVEHALREWERTEELTAR